MYNVHEITRALFTKGFMAKFKFHNEYLKQLKNIVLHIIHANGI